MSRFKLILITALGALAVPLFAASAAHADEYSCAFTGAAGPLTPDNSEPAGNPVGDPTFPRNDELGVESILTDLRHGDEGDGTTNDPLTRDPRLDDSDNGNGRGAAAPSIAAGGEDGDYSFATAADGVRCLYVPTGAAGPSRVAGVYSGTITSNGEYDNQVCGTGWAKDNGTDSTGFGGVELTKVDLPDIGATTGPAADIVDDAATGTATTYRIDFRAGQGALNITSATNADGETGSGQDVDGVVIIEPTSPAPNASTVPCVTANGDVTGFTVAGAFTGSTS